MVSAASTDSLTLSAIWALRHLLIIRPFLVALSLRHLRILLLFGDWSRTASAYFLTPRLSNSVYSFPCGFFGFVVELYDTLAPISAPFSCLSRLRYSKECSLYVSNKQPKPLPAYQWSANWGGTHPKLREIAMRDLAQPVGAGAEERNWSTYIFILDKRRNRFFVDRARKLVMCTSMSG
jgi:hypothetical protein